MTILQNFARFRVVAVSLLVSQSMMSLVEPGAAWAQTSAAPPLSVQQTAHYTVIVQFGDAEHIQPPGLATIIPSSEVMLFLVGVQSPMDNSSTGMDMSSTMYDQGMPANHHLSVHIVDNATGAVVNSVSPTIRLTPKTTQVTRELGQVMATYDPQIGQSDFHYGQNVYLPDDKYDVSIMFGSEDVEFQDIPVSGGGVPTLTSGLGG
jgi:hypothetical protein